MTLLIHGRRIFEQKEHRQSVSIPRGRDAEKIGPRGRRNSLKRLIRTRKSKEIKVNFSDFPCRNRLGPWKNSIRPNRSITHSTPERGPPSLGLLLQFAVPIEIIHPTLV